MLQSKKDEIVKANIDFIYGKAAKGTIADPDKVSYAKSHRFDEEANAIDAFTGDFDFLAPLYPCPVLLSLVQGTDTNTGAGAGAEGGAEAGAEAGAEICMYPSFEHALQASKTSDAGRRLSLMATPDARELKKMGSKWADDLAAWRGAAVGIADKLLRDKFTRNKELRDKLINTKSRPIVFKNDFGDQFWGVTLEGRGQNMLGKALERCRQQAQRGEDTGRWIRDVCSPLEVGTQYTHTWIYVLV
jgi:predicted NAD-dependent protein-ADP-ribosyltransferase YbiA (DUF1768 family)